MRESSKLSYDKVVHISTESLYLWYQAQLSRYENVSASNNSIDSKSGVLLAAGIAVLAINATNIINYPTVLGIIGSTGLIVSSIIASLAMHVRDSRDPVVTSKDRIDYYYMNDHDFVWQLISDVEDATDINKSSNKEKANMYYWVVYTFLLSGVILLLSSFVEVTLVNNL